MSHRVHFQYVIPTNISVDEAMIMQRLEGRQDGLQTLLQLSLILRAASVTYGLQLNLVVVVNQAWQFPLSTLDQVARILSGTINLVTERAVHVGAKDNTYLWGPKIIHVGAKDNTC